MFVVGGTRKLNRRAAVDIRVHLTDLYAWSTWIRASVQTVPARAGHCCFWSHDLGRVVTDFHHAVLVGRGVDASRVRRVQSLARSAVSRREAQSPIRCATAQVSVRSQLSLCAASLIGRRGIMLAYADGALVVVAEVGGGPDRACDWHRGAARPGAGCDGVLLVTRQRVSGGVEAASCDARLPAASDAPGGRDRDAQLRAA